VILAILLKIFITSADVNILEMMIIRENIPNDVQDSKVDLSFREILPKNS